MNIIQLKLTILVNNVAIRKMAYKKLKFDKIRWKYYEINKFIELLQKDLHGIAEAIRVNQNQLNCFLVYFSVHSI